MLEQIMLGLIGTIVGALVVVYSRNFVQNFGTNATAETYLGGGGTYTALRVFGVLITIISFLYMTGLLDNVFVGMLGGIGLAD